jgi:hypothetical protein
MSMMQTVSFHESIYYVLYYDKSDENNGLYLEKTLYNRLLLCKY